MTFWDRSSWDPILWHLRGGTSFALQKSRGFEIISCNQILCIPAQDISAWLSRQFGKLLVPVVNNSAGTSFKMSTSWVRSSYLIRIMGSKYRWRSIAVTINISSLMSGKSSIFILLMVMARGANTARASSPWSINLLRTPRIMGISSQHQVSSQVLLSARTSRRTQNQSALTVSFNPCSQSESTMGRPLGTLTPSTQDRICLWPLSVSQIPLLWCRHIMRWATSYILPLLIQCFRRCTRFFPKEAQSKIVPWCQSRLGQFSSRMTSTASRENASKPTRLWNRFARRDFLHLLLQQLRALRTENLLLRLLTCISNLLAVQWIKRVKRRNKALP